MSSSQFCIQQRQQEQQKLKGLLALGFTSSVLLHGVLAVTVSKWTMRSQKIAEPMELIIVQPEPAPKPKIESKPKPVVEPKPEPKPKPRATSKTVVEPKPKPKPKPQATPKTEPNKVITPQTTDKSPKPATTASATKPSSKKVLTTPTPSSSSPVVSEPSSNNTQISSQNNNNSFNSDVSNGRIATNSTPPQPQPAVKKSISCTANCQPEYPSALAGIEGNAGVKLTINSNGNVIGVELTNPHSNSQINRQALLAARQMRFSSSANSNATVQVNINFTVAGSQYDRAAREAKRRREQEAARQRQLEQEAAKRRREQEAARQRQLEQQRQAREEQLKKERQVRQQQSTPSTTPPQSEPTESNTTPQTQPKPLLPLNTEIDEEKLRKFRERIEQYQQ